MKVLRKLETESSQTEIIWIYKRNINKTISKYLEEPRHSTTKDGLNLSKVDTKGVYINSRKEREKKTLGPMYI